MNDHRPAGLILAGGRGERLGGCEKGLLTWQGEPFVAAISRALRPVVSALAVSANRELAAYGRWADAVLPDNEYPETGPLSGLYEGLSWAREQNRAGVIVATCDAPRLPPAWAVDMATRAEQEPEVVHLTQQADRYHPLHGYFPVSVLPQIERALLDNERRVQAVVAQLPVQWWDCDDFGTDLININRPEDLERLTS